MMRAIFSRFTFNPRRFLLVITPFVAAFLLRLLVIPVTRMPFDSDEAIFLLMSRHILAGERPLFFYGEAYGGSADSYLTALFYTIFNDSIVVARWIQSLEYFCGMLFAYLLARRLLPGASFGPLAILWLMALPPLLITTWTTPAVLYAVVIGLGNVIAYLGHRLLHEDADRLWVWLIFGAICGLSFWTFGLIVVYMLPVFLLFLWTFRRQRFHYYVLAALMFFVFSFPWWTQTLSGFEVIYNSDLPSDFMPPFIMRVFAFFVITLPSFLGFREPWSPEIIWPLISLPILLFYLASIVYAIPYVHRADKQRPILGPLSVALLGLQVLVWLTLYFGTRFSLDATGRYILPLYLVLFMATGLLLERLYHWRPLAAAAVLVIILTFNLATHLKAIQVVPPGITAQMNPALQFGNAYDQELIDFARAQGGRGYTHHWLSYKIAYLSHEQVILAALLPYRPDLKWNPLDNRYPRYVTEVEASPHPIYVTHREPNLEQFLQNSFAQHHINYQIKDIGPYRVYYSLSTVITPQEMGFGRNLD
jgi:4-amino-4-deoxy-L-arabinose transferase-like glycosyltransferase